MIAFTFPGQGSQAQGMGEPWTTHPSWELVEEASDTIGRDLDRLLCQAEMAELTETRNAQLATYVLSMVVLDAVERTGLEPAVMAGHSLGEYSALTAAGVISFSAGVRLVSERGEAMQAAADETDGTMAAVLGLDDADVDKACRRVDGDVWVANYNAPGQVIISGAPDAIEMAGAAAKELGAKRVMPIRVGGAFHTPFMSPARDRLRKALTATDLRDPNRPVYANVDGEAHTEGEEWSSLLGAQLTSPVLWRQTLHALHDSGVATFCELGPGSTLTGLAKRTLKGTTTVSVATPADVDSLLEKVSGATESGAVAEGELLYAVERLVVSPANGVFQPIDGLKKGQPIARGDLVGTVGDGEVRSAFSGSLQGLLAMEGERVTTSQPLAWLRSDTLGSPS